MRPLKADIVARPEPRDSARVIVVAWLPSGDDALCVLEDGSLVRVQIANLRIIGPAGEWRTEYPE